MPDLAALTGVRSGKRSYYPALRRSNDRLERTVRAMDSISRALVRTGEGPRTLLEEVVRAAAAHMDAEWVLLGLADRALPDARPRLLALDDAGRVWDRPDELPATLAALWAGNGDAVRVPMYLDGEQVGTLVVVPGLPEEPEPADLSVLAVLANQAAVSMHATQLYAAGLAHRRRAQQLYDEVDRQARELAARTAELDVVERRLRAADQRALLDAERNRIAVELHDSVSQYVLSAGLTVDVCQNDLAAHPVAERLGEAKDLIRIATDQLRSVIYALHQTRGGDDDTGLPELLAGMADQHRPQLAVALRVEGCPTVLGTPTEHALARIAGEALFNVSMHGQARRAAVRLRYRPTEVLLSISDDGVGDPVTLRRHLRLAERAAADGRHRGLANMANRARELGGRLAIRRSRMGGVRIEVTVPTGGTTA